MAAVLTPIYAIQGTELGPAKEHDGQVRTSQGVITQIDRTSSGRVRGFFIQDAEGDNDDATSDGLYVRVSSRTEIPDLAEGKMPGDSLERLQAHLRVPDAEDVATLRLHDFLDGIQTLLIAFTDDLARTFFRHEPSDGHQAQSQSQDDLPLPPPGNVRSAPGDHPPPGQP